MIVLKKFNEEKMQALEVLYNPPNELDAHGDYMTLEDIYCLVDSLNESIKDNIVKGAISHSKLISAYPIRGYVTPEEVTINGVTLPEGTPLVKMQFTDKDEWNKRKNGVWKGVSIGCFGEKID